MSLDKIARKLRELDLIEIAEKAIVKNDSSLIKYNTDEQLFQKGIDSLGRSLKEYTPTTKFLKRLKGQPTNRTTLKDKNRFYEGFELDSKHFPFGITSTDSKKEKLTEKYGDEIFGLTDENESEYLDEKIVDEVLDQAEDKILSAFTIL
jgi:hypothetical protein